MRHFFILILVCLQVACRNNPSSNLLTQGDEIRLASSDSMLVTVFNWAKKTSLGYKGKDTDPVGPWYEAALPQREAFCIRDLCHQCIGAEILGLSNQNRNMFTRFVSSISEEKDYCSYWEINRYNLPAPVDYASDDDFWYNLNANFDIIDACYRLFQWTGDSTYIFSKDFNRFFQLTLNEYIERWQLQPDRIMKRPALMNLRSGTIKYKYARGIPSYDESQDDMTVSSDLLGIICNGFRTYASILKLHGQAEASKAYQKSADKYLRLIDSLWWNNSVKDYHAFYKTDNKFYEGGVSNSEFLLWYGVVQNPERIEKALQKLKNSQVEVLSYLPELFSRYGYNEEGYEFLFKIYDDKRRDYPEAPAGAIAGIIKGILGIEPLAAENVICTFPKLNQKISWISFENLPVFSGLISVRHDSAEKTTFANKSDNEVTWRAMFAGSFDQIMINGKPVKTRQDTDLLGNVRSFTDVRVKANSQMTAGVLKIR